MHLDAGLVRIALALWLVVGLALTTGRARLRQDGEALWLEAHLAAPGRARPLVNLGVLADERGDKAAARRWFAAAAASDDREGRLLGRVNGLLLDYEEGRVDAAREELARVRQEFGPFRSYRDVRDRIWPAPPSH